MVIKNGNVLLDDFTFKKCDVETENTTIKDIGSICTKESFNASGCFVVPGFIDTHMHGAVGENFYVHNKNTLKAIAEFEAKNGTTSLVPAVSAAKEEKYKELLPYLADCVNTEIENGSKIEGIHSEGPFFCEKYRGAHLKENIRNGSKDEFLRLVDYAKNNIKIITLAPEIAGCEEVIKEATRLGIVASAGHTGATYKEICKAIENGITMSTHTFNAMSPLTHREPGVAGAFMINDKRSELISDFVHICPEIVKLFIKNKGTDKINLITDSELSAGMPDGEYNYSGRIFVVKNKVARVKDDGCICGGSSCLIDCVKNVVSLGFPLEEAVKMATKNPAETVKIYNKVGSITKGKRADILILNKDLQIVKVILRGKMI